MAAKVARLVVPMSVVSAGFGWSDAWVLAGVALVIQGATRRLLAVATVVLFTVAFPPVSWPTFWFCLAPLVWIWREHTQRRSVVRDAIEALAIGFAMGWVSTGFVRDAVPACGNLLHSAACVVFGVQFVALAMTIRLVRDRPVPVAAALSTAVAVTCAILESHLGIWSVTNLSLGAADTPLAQWAAHVTVFGVSGLLFLVNFLLVPTVTDRFLVRWSGPIAAVGIATAAWWSGALLSAATPISPLPFSVTLVQPHVRVSREEQYRPWVVLDRLTRESLLSGAGDLIVWPETSLSESRLDDPNAPQGNLELRMTIQDFEQALWPSYGANCLVGVPIWRITSVERYGLEVAEARRFNSACLVTGTQEIATHDKLALVPFRESLPACLNQARFASRLCQRLKLDAPLTPGSRCSFLSFKNRDGREIRIAVAICYESFFPWLPQYRHSADIDAVVHIVNDGTTADHPEVLQRQILACRYRAIETRKWNLVCSNWTGSAVIDPTGRVVCQLPATAGVLRFDNENRGGLRALEN